MQRDGTILRDGICWQRRESEAREAAEGQSAQGQDWLQQLQVSRLLPHYSGDIPRVCLRPGAQESQSQMRRDQAAVQ
jgi:hypothetical protein